MSKRRRKEKKKVMTRGRRWHAINLGREEKNKQVCRLFRERLRSSRNQIQDIRNKKPVRTGQQGKK